jgi:D-glycero-alpha-D-manno-heptose 1-phosphate guanylyltransferase
MQNKQLIVLAGGFGTRLQSILEGKPKPLANINGKPFLKFLLHKWIKDGFEEFIFSLHFSSQEIINFISFERNCGILKKCKVQIVVEPIALGTGGAISYVIENADVNSSFFVANADTWIGGSILELDYSDDNTILVVEVEDTSRYGKVMLLDNKIISFEEKGEAFGRGYINAGTYKLSKSIFHSWDEKPYSLENDLFPKLMRENKLFGLKVADIFIDIGIPIDYYSFCDFSKNIELK